MILEELINTIVELIETLLDDPVIAGFISAAIIAFGAYYYCDGSMSCPKAQPFICSLISCEQSSNIQTEQSSSIDEELENPSP